MFVCLVAFDNLQ